MEDLCEKYLSILHEYMTVQNEAVLYRASKLGKDLVERGIGPEEIVEAHSRAVQKALAQNLPRKSPGIILDSTSLLLEIMMAYSLAYREYMELKSSEMDSLQLYTKKLEEANSALEQKIKEISLIHDFACAFSGMLQTDSTAKLILEKLSCAVPYKSSVLFLRDENGNLRKVAAKGPKPLPEITVFPRSRGPHWNKEQGILTIPLLMDDKPLGYLILSLESEALPEELLRLLTIIANQATSALTRALLHEKVWLQSITDSKTGLFNFHYFQERCKELMSENRQLALLMLDLDDFKAFNDSFGHLKGDEALALLGQEISNIIRKKDIAARYGGEEFVVALPQTGYPQAKKAAERIRARIDQLDFGVPEKLTASIGIAVSPLDGTSFTQLLAQADKAMYYAKEQGKNRVCTAKEIPEE